MKKSLKRALAFGLLLTLAIGLAGCGGNGGNSGTNADGNNSQDNQQAAIDNAQNNQLKVGMECGYAPFNWTQLDDSNGAVPIQGDSSYANGYDVQIAKKIADDMGKELVIVRTEWDGLVPAVQSGVLDMIIAGMSPTADRRQSIDFSDNYYTSDLVMVVKADGAYTNATSIQDFSGAKITAQLNTFHDTVIDQIDSVDHVTAMESFPAMRVALESGIIDGYVSERPEGISASQANANFTYVEFTEGNGFTYDLDEVSIAAGLQQGSPLLEEINAALAKISEEERQKMMEDAIANQPAAE